MMDESSARFHPKRGRNTRGLRQHEYNIKAERLQYNDFHPFSSAQDPLEHTLVSPAYGVDNATAESPIDLHEDAMMPDPFTDSLLPLSTVDLASAGSSPIKRNSRSEGLFQKTGISSGPLSIAPLALPPPQPPVATAAAAAAVVFSNLFSATFRMHQPHPGTSPTIRCFPPALPSLDPPPSLLPVAPPPHWLRVRGQHPPPPAFPGELARHAASLLTVDNAPRSVFPFWPSVHSETDFNHTKSDISAQFLPVETRLLNEAYEKKLDPDSMTNASDSIDKLESARMADLHDTANMIDTSISESAFPDETSRSPDHIPYFDSDLKLDVTG
ncbi:unnamed protein product [Protopolystoma xenopodis]|uniref:Uncharacterized protein n=1 Tax=Protopolystoma xenopodis TaxID=117903 RepID=A0A448XC05_9PLAT|nr:unnamed protein product [Protopolystoma xenopodis]